MSLGKKIIVFSIGSIAILLFIFVISFMIYIKKTDAIVLSSDLTCHYRDVVYADQFIKSIDGVLLDKYLVDTSVVGKRKIEIQYKNRYGFVEQKVFEITVKDVTPPVIVVSNPLVVHIDEVDHLLDVILCADDYDDNISCVLKGDYDLGKVGEYSLTISAMDKSGNEETKDFNLKVLEKDDKKNNPSSSVKKKIAFKDVYQKYKTIDTEIGVDLSKWQGGVDFSKLVSSGVSFVMIKIGGQKEIGGDISLDPKFEQNIKGALQNHLKVGVYFYSYARNENEARKQARWVVQNLRGYDIDLPIAFDWENWDKYSKFGIGFRTLNRIASSFIHDVKHYNYNGILYSSKYYLENIWYQEEYDKWIAYYTDHFDYHEDYYIWQLCNNGRVDGIDGDVDIDVLKIK